MEKKRVVFTIITIFVAIIIIATVLVFPERVADANSVQRYFEGIDSSGAIVTMENCPIVVDKEDLDFYIYYQGKSNSQGQYEQFGSVCATYTFRNPSENTINMDVVFPYGFKQESDSGKDECSVSVDGAQIAWRTRYTHIDYYPFDIERDLSSLSDDFVQDSFFATTQKVYKYTYSVSDTAQGLDLTFEYDRNWARKVVCDFHSQREGNKQQIVMSTAGKPQLVFYVVGEDLDIAACDVTVIGGQKGGHLSLVSRQEQTFGDELAYINRPADSDVLDIDWYNALANTFNSLHDRTVINPLEFVISRYPEFSLFRWCQYTLSIAPGQTIVNSVTVPLFPARNERYIPAVYEFIYYLSPATTWAGFKDLTVNIHTDGYLLNYAIKGFAKTDGGYTYHSDTLPEGELTFKICSEETQKSRNSGFIFFVIIFLYILAIVLGLTVGAPLVVFSITITIIAIVKSVKKKKADKTDKSVVPTQQYEPMPSDLTSKYADMFSDFDVKENTANTKATDSSGLTFFDGTDNQDVTMFDGNTAEKEQTAQTVIESEENDENVVHSETDGNSMKSDLKNTDESSDAYKFW